MTYATALDMLIRFDADEIAQRSDRLIPRLVSGALLRDVANNADLSGYDEDAVVNAALAMTRLDRALADARDTIASHISARYKLPISPVPPVLQRIACDLARFYLYDDTATEQVKDRHDAAMKLLASVRDGKATLGENAETGEQAPSTAGAELVSGGRVWRRDDSRGFI